MMRRVRGDVLRPGEVKSVLEGPRRKHLRLLMISNQVEAAGYAGFQVAYRDMVRHSELSAFAYIAPSITAARAGEEAAFDELWKLGAEFQPNVILVVTPHRLGYTSPWVQAFVLACGGPQVVYYEADPWGSRAKPVKPSMTVWLDAADVVFTVAREPHVSLFRSAGASDVRFIPHTYCHVAFGGGEHPPHTEASALEHDVVLIGSRLARWGRLSRLPGAVERARLVRALQRQDHIRLAIYGRGWKGRGTKGVLTFEDQIEALRAGLMSANWDHFPTHADYASDRLAISLISGRVHVTTAHPGFSWLPGSNHGLFLEPTVQAVVARIVELRNADPDEILQLGLVGHRWAVDRLSHRQASRFMLGAIDRSLLERLPAEPWRGLADEWPT